MASNEKRLYPRYDSLNLSYVCVDENGDIVNEGIGRTLNVSERGILLETHFQIKPGQRVSVTIAIEDDLLDVTGNVARSTGGKNDMYEAGIEFTDMDAAARQHLKKYIAYFQSVVQQDQAERDHS